MMNEKGPLHFSRESWVDRGDVDAPRWEVKGGGRGGNFCWLVYILTQTWFTCLFSLFGVIRKDLVGI